MTLNKLIREAFWSVQRAHSIHLEDRVDLMRANKKAGRDIQDQAYRTRAWNDSMKLLLIREHELSVYEEAKKYRNK